MAGWLMAVVSGGGQIFFLLPFAGLFSHVEFFFTFSGNRLSGYVGRGNRAKRAGPVLPGSGGKVTASASTFFPRLLIPCLHV